MTGRALDEAHAPGNRQTGEELLGLPVEGEGIAVHRGRVSGLTRLLGSGSGALLRAAFGAGEGRPPALSRAGRGQGCRGRTRRSPPASAMCRASGRAR
jgi:hypothetical protein